MKAFPAACGTNPSPTIRSCVEDVHLEFIKAYGMTSISGLSEHLNSVLPNLERLVLVMHPREPRSRELTTLSDGVLGSTAMTIVHGVEKSDVKVVLKLLLKGDSETFESFPGLCWIKVPEDETRHEDQSGPVKPKAQERIYIRPLLTTFCSSSALDGCPTHYELFHSRLQPANGAVPVSIELA